MNQLTLSRTPQVIAVEINGIRGQVKTIMLQASIEIGRRLVEAKDQLSHGEWGKWLEESVDYSQSTANNLMALYREYGSQNSQALENLSYTKALALLGVPAKEREQFIAEHDVENMSARALQEAIKVKEQLEEQLRKSEAKAEAERKAREQAAKKLEELERKNTDREQLIDRLKVELADAKIAGDDDEAARVMEDLKKSQSELATAQEKVKQLEEQLKAKPIDVPATVEVIPPEIEAELAELRKKVAQPSGAAAVKFKLQFDSLVAGFRDLLGTLEEIKSGDPESHEKYKAAVAGLAEKMKERL